MNLLFIGMQGSGKGTQAKILSEKLKIPPISAGDLLRSAKGEIKVEINSYINHGKFISDKLMIKIIKERIKEGDCKKGFILDGFPRTLKQAEEIDKVLKIHKVIEIYISDKEAKKRLSGRWNCKKCKISYNLITSPKPKKQGICDVCEGKLSQREDDTEEKAVNARLSLYHKETEPVLKHYTAIRINGEQNIEKVTEDIEKALSSKL